MKTPNTLRHALLLFAVAGSAAGQSIGFYSDLQYNSGSGSASTFAQTWSDYSTQYYYDISVYSQLNVSQNGGPFQITCQVYGYGYNQNASASCNSNVGTGTVDLEILASHSVTATYYVYQFDSWCSWDCYYYWDAFRTSFMGAGGVYQESNPSFYAPGPPAQRTQQQTTASAYTSKRKSSRLCSFPTSESSWFTGNWGNAYPYAAGFNTDLFPFSNWNGRYVGETLVQLQGDTCWYPGSPYSQMYIPGGGGWIVGTQRREFGIVASQYSNVYGWDFVGFTNTNMYLHYRSRMQSSGNQCGVMYQQRMWMDGCGGQSQEYGWPHGLLIYVNGWNGLTSTRSNASASKW